MSQSTTVTRSSSGPAISVKNIAFIGIFGAIAAILMYIEFPLPIAPPFYKLDFSEVPVLIGTFSLGPVAGILIEIIKNLLHLLIKGTSTGGVGEIANAVIGCAFIVPAGLIYKLKKNRKNAIIGMAAGTVVMAVAGAFMNALVLLPAYAAAFHWDLEEIVKLGTAVNSHVTDVTTFAVICVVPFNIVKGVLVSVVTFLLYKRISVLIHKAGGH